MCDVCLVVFFFKQTTAYEMRISDWSSDVFSSDLVDGDRHVDVFGLVARHVLLELFLRVRDDREVLRGNAVPLRAVAVTAERDAPPARLARRQIGRASCRVRVGQYV